MQRPALPTLACINPACSLLRRPGEAHRSVRKVYGHDQLRLLRCGTCGEECSERRDTAFLHTKRSEATAEDVIRHWDAGCSSRATARLVHVGKATGARVLRVAGRQAQQCHDQHWRGLTPTALECDEQGSFVKKSSNGARGMRQLSSSGVFDIHSSVFILPSLSPLCPISMMQTAQRARTHC